MEPKIIDFSLSWSFAIGSKEWLKECEKNARKKNDFFKQSRLRKMSKEIFLSSCLSCRRFADHAYPVFSYSMSSVLSN